MTNHNGNATAEVIRLNALVEDIRQRHAALIRELTDTAERWHELADLYRLKLDDVGRQALAACRENTGLRVRVERLESELRRARGEPFTEAEEMAFAAGERRESEVIADGIRERNQWRQ